MIFTLLLMMIATQSLSPEASQHMKAGLAADQQRQLDVAISEFRKVTELAPGFVDGFVDLGQACLEKRDFQAAVAPLNHALKIDPDSLAAHRLLGYALLAQGYATESIPHLKRRRRLRHSESRRPRLDN